MVAPVDGVLPAVVVALEPDHQPAPGVRAGDPDGAAHGLAARDGEPDHVDARHGSNALAPRLNLERVWQPEARAVLGDRGSHRSRHDRVPVAQDHRSEPEQVVHVLVAVRVVNPRARAVGHEWRIWHPAELRGSRAAPRATRDDLAGLLVELPRTARPGRLSGFARHLPPPLDRHQPGRTPYTLPPP